MTPSYHNSQLATRHFPGHWGDGDQWRQPWTMVFVDRVHVLTVEGETRGDSLRVTAKAAIGGSPAIANLEPRMPLDVTGHEAAVAWWVAELAGQEVAA